MDKQALIDGLNEDLAGELSAIIQYTTYAAKATGRNRVVRASAKMQPGELDAPVTSDQAE